MFGSNFVSKLIDLGLRNCEISYVFEATITIKTREE